MTQIPMPRPRGPMIKDAPDHHDAELVLRLYEIRRESSLREARSMLAKQFLPGSLDEALAITKADHPGNQAWRQVGSYWEMAYGMARHGIVNPDYLVEFNGEGLYLYAKIQPWLAEIRAASFPSAFTNAEWLATHSEAGAQVFTIFRSRVEKALAARRPS